METLLILLGGAALIVAAVIYDAFAWGFVLYKAYGVVYTSRSSRSSSPIDLLELRSDRAHLVSNQDA